MLLALAGPAVAEGDASLVPPHASGPAAEADAAQVYHELMAAWAANPSPGTADRLQRWMVAFASTTCRTPGVGATGSLDVGDREMVQAVAAALADGEGGNAAVRLEAILASAQCLIAAGDDDAAAAQFRSAVALARANDDPETANPVRARVADAAGMTGLVPAEDIVALADGMNAPHFEAVIVRAWAISTLLRQGTGNFPATGIYDVPTVDADALADMSERALDDGDDMQGFLLAAAIEVSLPDVRQPLIARAFAAAMERGDQAAARLIARAISDASDRSDWFEQMAEQALAANLPADAEYVARLMEPSRNTINVWLDIATAYRNADYSQPLDAALAAALDIAQGLAGTDSGSALMRVAGRAAQLDRTDLAASILTANPEGTERPRAVADLAKRLAERDEVDEALAWAEQIDTVDVDPEVRARAFGPIAKRMAEMDRLEEAIQLLADRPDLSGDQLDRALRTLAVELARAGRTEEAADFAGRIVDPEERARAEAELAQARGDAAFDRLIDGRIVAALDNSSDGERRRALVQVAGLLAEFGSPSRLVALRQQVLDAGHGSDMAPLSRQVGVAFAEIGRFDDAVQQIGSIDDPAALDAARSAVSILMADRGHVRDALDLARSMRDAISRLTTFRTIAEIQARRLDEHDLIPAIYTPHEDNAGRPSVLQPEAATDEPVLVHARGGLAVLELQAGGTPDWLDASGLRAHAGSLSITPAAIRHRVTSATPRYVAIRLPVTASPYNEKFVEIVPIIDYAQRQGEPMPQVIYLESGTVTLSMLRETLLRLGKEHYLEDRHGIYTLRRPLVIGPQATLVLSGADVKELRLSTSDYAYVVNGGSLVIADTRITSWDLAADSPSELPTPESAFQFRPFMTSWSGSETYAARSVFRALGYNNRKSWGFTASAGPQDFMDQHQPAMPSPQVQLVENLFERMYYGFYSYQVDDAILLGNEFRNSVIYGPDPHDYSNNILMALNTAYGTRKKHGLIVSRGVSGLFIGNIAFENHGAGIMLDRLSNHSIIYANTALDNENDGISVYETACAIVANNLVSRNALGGLRIRNSVDIGVFDNVLSDNSDEGVIAYTDQLLGHDWRNRELDPFWTVVTANFVGNRITGNDGAMRLEDMLAATLVDNTMLDNGSKALIVGGFRPILTMVTRTFRLSDSAMVLVDLCQTPVERHSPCTFRDNGIFRSDGQQDWTFGAAATPEPPDCEGAYRVTNLGVIREPGL